MLTFYHTRISPNSRRVWITLLEKGLQFEEKELNLDGEQFQPEFLLLNPFHHIPVLVDDGFSVIESLAILDYLEAKYPTPKFLPTDAKAIAKVRMVEMVTVNELTPNMNPLFRQMMGFGEAEPQKLEQARQQCATVLSFFENLLGDCAYFGGENLSLADIVAGAVVPLLANVKVSIDSYPRINAWSKRLMERPAWAMTQPTPEAMSAFKARVQARMAAQQSR